MAIPSSEWLSFIQQLDAFERERRRAGGHALWYRGQADASWSLWPTLHRFVTRAVDEGVAAGRTFPADGIRRLFWEYSKTLYLRYRERTCLLVTAAEHSDPWCLLYSMQHYGLPTPLLDWTGSVAAALFFALKHAPKERDAALFVLDAERLNESTVGFAGLITPAAESSLADLSAYHPHWWCEYEKRPSNTIAIAPIWSNKRMVAQRGGFTLTGYAQKPLEEMCSSSILRKFILPQSAFGDAEDFLRRSGIRWSTVFPDLEGVAREVIDEVGQEARAALDGLGAQSPKP